MPKRIELDGEVHEFPDDFTDEDIAAALGPAPAAPNPALTPDGDLDLWSMGPEGKRLAVGREVMRMPGRVVDAAKQYFTPDPESTPLSRAVKPFTTLAEVGASVTSGMAAQPVAMFTENPKQTIEDMTYQPRGNQAKAVLNAAGGVMAPVSTAISGAAKDVGEAVGVDPTRLEATANTASMVVPGLQALRARGAAAAAARSVPKTKISETPVESLRAAGFKFRPSDVRAVEPGKKMSKSSTAERVGDSESLRKSILLKNQNNATRLAIEDLELPKDTVRITPNVLSKLREPEIATYNEMGAAAGKGPTSPDYNAALDAITKDVALDPAARGTLAAHVEQYRFPQLSGPDAVKAISKLRRRAARQQQNQDVGTQDLGKANREIANALEDELARRVAAGPNPELVQKFTAAREKLAKIHDIEEATVAGQIDAAAMKALRDKGVKLSGRLAVIADAAEYLPNVTRHAGTITNMGPEGAFAKLADLPAAGVRKMLESDWFQNKLGPEAKALGPDAGLSDYFNKPKGAEPAPQPPPDLPPTPASSALRAEQMSGDLELQPEQFPNAVEAAPTRARPTDLQIADDFVPEGVPFRGEPQIADELLGGLELDEASRAGGIPGGQSPRAAGMAQDVPGTTLFPELRAIRGKPDEVAGELSIADDLTEQDLPGAVSTEGIEVQEVQAPRPKEPETKELTVESPGGAIIMRPAGDYMRIRYAKTKEPGKGEGTKLYLQAIKDAEAKGKLGITSDVKVSESAARVYDKLERLGFNVKRNPAKFDKEEKVWTSNVSTKPVFEVRRAENR